MGRCEPEAQRATVPALVVNELSADNEGNWIDELGETDDWIELLNAGDETIELSDYRIGDADAEAVPLASGQLEPGARVVVWADDSPEQGTLHLPFKLSAGSDRVVLWRGCELADAVELRDMGENEVLARFPDGAPELSRCRYASPGRVNPEACVPPGQPALRQRAYSPFEWPQDFGAPHGPLAINELALRPATFVEVVNTSQSAQSLSAFALELAAQGPGQAWPSLGDGAPLSPDPDAGDTLAPGERALYPVADSDVAALAADPAFEGVATLFDAATGAVIDRVDFMRWPDGAALSREGDGAARMRFCATATPGDANETCDPLPSRDVGDRVRHLRTPGDYAALSEGATQVGTESVKFVLDMQAGDVVHLLGSRAWALHYTFVREMIYGEPPLDRCDAEQNKLFYAGWRAFSKVEYDKSEGRRFLLGTLAHHGARDLYGVEFAAGDKIAADQVERAFFAAAAHVEQPQRWALRPQGDRQTGLAVTLDGRLPIIDENEPFVDVRYQPLTQTVGYGELEFVGAAELASARLGPRTIVVTDDVPNDIPLVGGLITEAFQTPLAHVNVLSQNRDTPNMSLRDARNDPRIEELLGQLVRLDVGPGGFSIGPADVEEAEAFWAARAPAGPAPVPRLDLDVRDLQPLTAIDYAALPIVGAKAAQLAELMRVNVARFGCSAAVPLPLPAQAFAVPVVHSIEHLRASGAQALLEELWADPELRGDPVARGEQLARVRTAILTHPVERVLLKTVSQAILDRYGQARVRLRSSSNTEDLPGFNGAGLYTSFSAAMNDPDRRVEDALRGVWASLWNERAYDERELARIDHRAVAMGVLVHPAYLSERAQGVAVSRSLLDPTRGDMVYINAQAGEASVTNPAPGVTTEEVLYRMGSAPEMRYLGASSLTQGAPILTPDDARGLSCAITAIHDHFRALLDPGYESRLFAIEIEWKLIGRERRLLIKQARPHPFNSYDIPADCRDL